ncbi:MAG: xanthine phosphoribosyltransferase [Clostridiaceae bacterium]|nr:xanthine phosphoribosyltransferase [Clostridiaceae bacterium]
MEALEKKILMEGRVLTGNILKVDSFLNHQMDPLLMQAIGQEFARRFAGDSVTKILTLEASGIAPALFTGLALGVPVLFAKKTAAGNMDPLTYSADVYSYTRNRTYTIRVSRNYLSAADRILIIDDFLARGQAVLGMAELIGQAGASLAGAGIVIEKGFQDGGAIVRQKGIRVESLAIIKDMTNGQITFS